MMGTDDRPPGPAETWTLLVGAEAAPAFLMLATAGLMLDRAAIRAALERLDRLDAAGWTLDPTAYRRAMHNIPKVRAMLVAMAALAEACAEAAEPVAGQGMAR